MSTTQTEYDPTSIKVGKNYLVQNEEGDQVTLDPEDPFEKVLIDMVRTNRRKRKDYAVDSDVFSNFRSTAGWTKTGRPEWSALFNVAQKLARLQSLAENGRLNEPANEAVEDTFLDLAVYSVIAYAIYREWVDASD